MEKSQEQGSFKTTQLFNQAYLKLGISGSTAIQMVVQSYVFEKESTDGELKRSKGFADLALRIKQNLVGNGKGDFAIALLPYLKFPTATVQEDDR